MTKRHKQKRRGNSSPDTSPIVCLHETSDCLKIEGATFVGFGRRFLSVLFMLGWTLGCVLLPHSVFSLKGDMPLWGRCVMLGGIWASWPMVILTLLWQNWFWESLQIDINGVLYRRGIRFRRVFLPLKNRRIPLNEVGFARIDNCREGGTLDSDLMLPTTDRPIYCFGTSGQTTSAGKFLKPLNQRLKQLGVTNERPLNFGIECFRWKIQDDRPTPTFTRHGHVYPGLLGGTLLSQFWDLKTLAFRRYLW